MRDWLNDYYSILEIDASKTFEHTKQSYKELSFIWHPDRHPEQYKKRAEEKIQKLNEAFSYFEKNREYLSNAEQKWEFEQSVVVSNPYESKLIECVRCNASGYVAESVENSQNFNHVDCHICNGNAYVIIDERNCCLSCEGKGMNPNITESDREEYIQYHLEKLNIIEKFHSKLITKKLWLKFYLEKMLCQSCEGVGYFYYRSNKRKENKDRRLSSEADFLFMLENSEKRKQDRRKPIPA
jgi:hypothetical protein